jgi:hypothetical protein
MMVAILGRRSSTVDHTRSVVTDGLEISSERRRSVALAIGDSDSGTVDVPQVKELGVPDIVPKDAGDGLADRHVCAPEPLRGPSESTLSCPTGTARDVAGSCFTRLTWGVPYLSRPGGACPAGFVSGADVVGVAGAGALLGGGDEAEDNCSAPVEFDEAVVLGVWVADRRAGICVRAVVPRIATEGRGAGGSVSMVVLGEGGVMVGEDAGVVVADGCRSSVSRRWPVLAPGQLGNAPAKTRTASAAAVTTAAPITSAAAT